MTKSSFSTEDTFEMQTKVLADLVGHIFTCIIRFLSDWVYSNEIHVHVSSRLTLRTYCFPVRVYSFPPMVNTMSGRLSILLQSTVYCNGKTRQTT